MDFATVMNEVEAWPVEERFRLFEALWERLIESGYCSDLTAEQKEELDRRLAALDHDPRSVFSWEQVQLDAKRAG